MVWVYKTSSRHKLVLWNHLVSLHNRGKSENRAREIEKEDLKGEKKRKLGGPK